MFVSLQRSSGPGVQYPVAAYSADELAKVREWEKTWAGKKIDTSNIDQVAQFLPDQIVQLYKNPKKWGAPEKDGLFFSITPYQQVTETTGVIAATKKYAPTVKVNAEGDIINYADIAGVPFPNPKTGLEIAWNFDFNTHGDSNHYARKGPVIAPGVSIERTTHQDQWELYWIHRTDVAPLPAYAENPKGIHRGLVSASVRTAGKPEFDGFLTCAILIKIKKMTDICGMRPSAESGALMWASGQIPLTALI